MAIDEDPYFVTADPYGDLLEGDVEEEDFGEEEVQQEVDVDDIQQEEFYYAEGEEEEAAEASFQEEGAGYSAEGAFVEEDVEAFDSAEVEDGEEEAEEHVEECQEQAEEYELQYEYQTEQEPEAEEIFQDQGTLTELTEELPEEEPLLDLPDDLPGEVEPCSPGLGDFPEDELEETDEGLGFHTGLEEVDYTPQDSAEGEEVEESDEEPQWLRNVGVLDPKVAEEADVSAAFLDGLTGSEMDLDMAFPQYIPCLARYLVGHPEALVTKKKKGHKKGSGKRYFGGEDRSEDVMADKVVVGCWACGKLDHESQECIFKRCFVCSEQGHEVSECRSRNLSCKRCYRQGHFSDQCPMDQYDASFDTEEDMSFCRCMKCGEEGHLNCGSLPRMEFIEADPQQGWYENGQAAHQERSNNGSWSPQGDRWERQGGWDGGWQQNNAMQWMFQAGLSPLPVGQVDWVPPAGDGGGYGDNGNYGGGNRWMRSGNNKGWGGGNRWNGGWGRQGDHWDHGGGWGGWDGGHHKRRRR